MARNFPPFASIRAFEAAARHCNYMRASEELSLTPSAISHQVKSLEDFLGVRLFYRRNGKLFMTETGQVCLKDLTKILDDLENATARVKKHRQKGNVTINLFPSLASSWLVPKLHSFRDNNPEVNVKMSTSLKPLDFASSDIDMAIWYRKKDDFEEHEDKKFNIDFLFDEDIIPVCSEKYLEENCPLKDVKSVLNHSLIYCELQPEEWSQWCEAVGIHNDEPKQRIDTDNRFLAMKAAQDGLGIAMGRRPTHEDDLLNGRLVTPFPFDLVTGYAYYLICPKRSLNMPSVKKFRAWLLDFLN